MRLAIILARGGSKRIPRKNYRLFCGKPMIYWAIKSAKVEDPDIFLTIMLAHLMLLNMKLKEFNRLKRKLIMYVVYMPPHHLLLHMI